MLVLSRRLYEVIEIGGNIAITVVDIRANKVMLGIAAPPDMPVHRRENADLIRRQKLEQKPPLAIRTDTKEGSD